MNRDELRAAAAREVDRWERELGLELDRLFTRQQQVVLARLRGEKARRHTRHWRPPGDRVLDAAYVVPEGRWGQDAAAATSPLLREMIAASYTRVAQQVAPDANDPAAEAEDVGQVAAGLAAAAVLASASSGVPSVPVGSAAVAATALGLLLMLPGRSRPGRGAGAVVPAAVEPPVLQAAALRRLTVLFDQRAAAIVEGVEAAAAEVRTLIAAEEAAASPMETIAERVTALYDHRRPVWSLRMAVAAAVTSINEAALFAAVDAGSEFKQWLSRRDDRVRDTHEHADGQRVGILERFQLGGIPSHPKVSWLLFPRDPGPDIALDEVIGCRCTLLFSLPPKRGGATKGAPALDVRPEDASGVEVKGRVAAGVEGDECSCCDGLGEHRDGHECYVCDASGSAAAQRESSLVFCEGHHGTADDGPGNARERYGDDYVHKAWLVGAEAAAGDGSLQLAAEVARELGLEAKDVVRTPAGAAHYGQPIGTVIHRDPLVPTFKPPTAASSSTINTTGVYRPMTVVGKVGRGRVERGTMDGQVRSTVTRYSKKPPDWAHTDVLTLRDSRGGIGAFVSFVDTDGGPAPRGTVLEVSVAPQLQGQKVGDQLVALAVQLAGVTAPQRPAPSSRPVSPAPPRGRPAYAPPARPKGPIFGADGLPIVRDRTRPGDVPGPSGDFAADSARIERLQRAYQADRMDTTSLYSRGGRWTREREKQQQEIIDHFLNQPGVKADRKLLVLAGLPGAGKTTTITSAAGQAEVGVDLSEYVTVNADEVKDQMVARGMVPDYPGLTKEESATLFHAESFEIAHALMRQAARRDLNFAYDTSLKSSAQLYFATDAGRKSAPPPYDVTLVLVDVPIRVAKARAEARYTAGGRFMPSGLIDLLRASGRYSSEPSRQFDTVKGQAGRWFVFDNTGAAPTLVGSGGRRAKAGVR